MQLDKVKKKHEIIETQLTKDRADLRYSQCIKSVFYIMAK